MFKITLKIGKSMIEYQSSDVKGIHKFSAIYGAMPSVCDNCKSDDIYLSHKAPKGDDYYTLTCKKCGAELTLHQKKAGGFYIKYDEKMKVYSSQSNGNPKTNENKQDLELRIDNPNDEDIPF